MAKVAVTKINRNGQKDVTKYELRLQDGFRDSESLQMQKKESPYERQVQHDLPEKRAESPPEQQGQQAPPNGENS